MAKNMALFLLAMAVAMAVSMVSAQTNPPSCVANLIACSNSINATTPSAACCTSLRTAVTNDLPCLCNLFENRDLFTNFNINRTQALQLPRRCNITQGIDACNVAVPAPAPTAGGGSPGSPGGGGSGSPGGGGSGSPGGSNDGVRVGSTGVSVFVGMLLLLASLHV